VGLGDVVDKLLNEHSLADTGTTEETNLSTTGVGGEKIDDLDTSDEDLSRGGLLNELGGFGVDREALVSLDGTTLVNGVTSDVHDTAKSLGADGNGDGSTGILGGSTSDETLSTCEMELGCIFVKIRNDDDIPSMAMQRTTFSPRCC
jgi:hypothetical protein